MRPLPYSSHACIKAGAEANGFSLGVMIVSFSIPRDPEGKTMQVGPV
jgi:hypothetical protein